MPSETVVESIPSSSVLGILGFGLLKFLKALFAVHDSFLGGDFSVAVAVDGINSAMKV